MRTSDLVALAVVLVFPALVATGCIDGSTCLRNSDCPSADICSVGACILAPTDSEGGTDEGGAEASTLVDAAPPADTGTGKDATLSDADADAGDAGNVGDAGDAGDAGATSNDAGNDASDAASD
jgi:hypothetical protein